MSRRVLAIETSCDETAAAVVSGRTLESDVVATQLELHEVYGGVVPEIASRRHLELIDVVIEEALTRAGVRDLSELDAIAVTQGPGLIGALLVGVAGAKARSWAAGVPLIAVDHLFGHVASAMLAPDSNLEPPYLCALVSGGHTLLLDVDEGMQLTLLGSTRDDAAGEAFDKGARMLQLPMPGGPSIAKLALDGDPSRAPMTPAMVNHPSLDTSFSGIKTALAQALQRRAASPEDGPSDADLSAAYEVAIVETIAASVRKLLKARGAHSGHQQARQKLALVGGVAANERLRSKLAEICSEYDVESVATPLQWCGDNAAMIGVAASWGVELDALSARQLDAFATSPLFRDSTKVPN